LGFGICLAARLSFKASEYRHKSKRASQLAQFLRSTDAPNRRIEAKTSLPVFRALLFFNAKAQRGQRCKAGKGI
jgi:hypothetical protein